MILSCLEFCKNMLDSSKQYINDFYLTADCNYTKHRFYNPKTYALFGSEEDFKALRFPRNHFYYIKVDPSDILTEYQIMLVSEGTDGAGEHSLELFNSVYPIIMLCKDGTNNIIGILKPGDTETFTLRGHHTLVYRKYVPKLRGYVSEMYSAVNEKSFNYYPYLSEMTAVILSDDGTDTSPEAKERDDGNT